MDAVGQVLASSGDELFYVTMSDNMATLLPVPILASDARDTPDD